LEFAKFWDVKTLGMPFVAREVDRSHHDLWLGGRSSPGELRGQRDRVSQHYVSRGHHDPYNLLLRPAAHAVIESPNQNVSQQWILLIHQWNLAFAA